MLAMVALASLPRAAAADNAPTLKVDPATQNVAPGQQFTVNIVQSATIETSGVQLDITFDPKLLQLKDFVLGQAYTSANAIFAFGNADLGTSGNKGAAMGRANKFGTLENVAGFLALVAIAFAAFLLLFWRGLVPPPYPSPYLFIAKLAVAAPVGIAVYALALRSAFRGSRG